MSTINVMLRKLRNLSEQIFSVIIISSPAIIFSFFINIRFILSKLPDRVYYKYENKTYCLKTLGEVRFFKTKFQNYNSYKMGATKRNLKLNNEYLVNNIEIKPDDLIIDCGANIGDFYFALRSKSPAFKYVAFEPSTQEFKLLQKNIGLNGECLNIGLWDKEEKLIFFVSNRNADSSFIQPDTYTDQIQIQAKRLDSIETRKIKLLKLEAEGAEMQVLLGLGSLIKTTEYIAADLGFENSNRSTLPEVTNFLLNNNFEIINFGFPRIVVLFKNKLIN